MAAGEFDLDALEDPELSDEDVSAKLAKLPGLGPFSSANMLQLLGRYSAVACDSETIRHLKVHHRRTVADSKQAQKVAEEVSTDRIEQMAMLDLDAFHFTQEPIAHVHAGLWGVRPVSVPSILV